MEETKNDARDAGRAGLPEEAGERRARVEISPLSIPVIEAVPQIPGMVGASARMRQFAAEIIRKARFDFDVLIEGQTGTGKTVAARALYEASQRAGKPFVKINSSQFQRDLVESELFGHEKGAFTGATERRIGFFEAARGGVLFFDEIGEMPPKLQAKILTAVEEKVFFRLGGREPVECDVRILYATNRNLEAMIEAGTFREDLYHRIKALRLRVPSLDERREDIPALVANALDGFARKHGGGELITVEDRAMAMLLERAWPGNVRELQQAVFELAVSLDGRTEITADDVDAVLGPNVGQLSVGERDGDAKTLQPPPYLIGEETQHYQDRTLVFIFNTLLKQTGSASRAAEIMQASSLHALKSRLRRAEHRLRTAATNARLFGKVERVLDGRVKRRKDGEGEDGEGNVYADNKVVNW